MSFKKNNNVGTDSVRNQLFFINAVLRDLSRQYKCSDCGEKKTRNQIKFNIFCRPNFTPDRSSTKLIKIITVLGRSRILRSTLQNMITLI
uniref:Uncharacterized protein n=1 Tax=Lepeophtheirus salmonis TaxID=72036 RepID=A0A0K2U5D6_LEPSM